MDKYAIGIDVGGTKVAYGLFDASGKLFIKKKLPSRKDLSSEAYFEVMLQTVRQMLAEQQLTEADLRGIGIDVPSTVLFEKGMVINSVNLPMLNNFDVRSYMRQKLGSGVKVVLDNDAHAAALAEYRRGAGRGFKHMVYCAVSTGVSTGLIINGQVFRGTYGFAGESGHMLITPDEGVECGCGNKGCFESYCSGSKIVTHIQKAIASGAKTQMVELAGGAEHITAEHLLQAYRGGDELARQMVAMMAHYMGLWLFNVYVFLNINCFVFGGGLLNFGDILFKPVREVFDHYNRQRAYPVYFKKAELGDDFGIYGAVELLDDVK
jgi:glucokinase